MIYIARDQIKNLFTDPQQTLIMDGLWLSGYEGQVSIKQEPKLHTTYAAGSKPYVLATFNSNLWWATDMLGDVTAPAAEWVFDPLTKYWYFQSSFRLGTQLAEMNKVIINA